MTGRQKNLSIPAISVLAAVSRGSRYGFEIMEKTGLASGTVYPILGRLTESGFVTSRWERYDSARSARRPARKYYATTDVGEAELEKTIDFVQNLGGFIAPQQSADDNG